MTTIWGHDLQTRDFQSTSTSVQARLMDNIGDVADRTRIFVSFPLSTWALSRMFRHVPAVFLGEGGISGNDGQYGAQLTPNRWIKSEIIISVSVGLTATSLEAMGNWHTPKQT